MEIKYKMKSINQNSNIDRPVTYQIRVQGRIDESWSDWFDGMAITFEKVSDGGAISALTGAVVDQAALHGLIVKILNHLDKIDFKLEENFRERFV